MPDLTAEQVVRLAERVLELEDGIRRHRQLSDEERGCCDDCIAAGKAPWAPERDVELWRHVDA